MHEFELIKRCFDDWDIHQPNLLKGIGDDCLIWRSPEPLVVSTDTVVIGRHFPASASPLQVANRAFLPAISDLAAMCATPAFFTLAVTLPASLDDAWLLSFSGQLRILAEHYQCQLAGGDTTGGEQLTITVSVHGNCSHPVMRGGALAGDDIWVSGKLGGAAAALPYILQNNESQAPTNWLNAYWQPEPQVELGKLLHGRIHSAIDISDGLAGDIAHIAEQSQVDLSVNLADLPLADGLDVNVQDHLRCAVAGGDDYQLCFTATQSNREYIASIAEQLNLSLTRIGEVKEGNGQVQWYDAERKIELPWHSFEHF